MAVVTKYGRGSPDPSLYKLPDALYAQPVSVHLFSDVAIANGDSANSLIYVGKVRSSARMSPGSLIYHTAITGLTSLDLGFPNVGAGNGAILAAALDVSAAGSKNAMNAVSTPNLYKRMWELCGLTSDPGGEFDLIAKMNQAAGAAGTLAFNITSFLRGG